MTTQTPIVFDNDCISSFLWVKRIDILKVMFPNQIILPKPVLNEIEKMKSFPKYKFIFEDLCCEIANGEIVVQDIIFPSAEATEYAQLTAMTNPKRIGKGEAAAIVLAKYKLGTLASNNLKDIIPHVSGGKPPYVCTDTILYSYYDAGHMNSKDGCEIWDEMKSKRRVLPPYDFNEVIRRMQGHK